MLELLTEAAPSWAVGIGFILMIIREIIFNLKDKNAMFKALTNYQDIYDVLDEIEEKTGADRVTLLKAHDSGNVLTPDTKLFSSVLFSTAVGNLRGVKDKWKEQPLDRPYVKLLMDLTIDKSTRIESAKLEKGILKSLYDSDEIKISYLAEVMQIKKRKSLFNSLFAKEEVFEYVYISANFTKEIADFSYIADNVRTGAGKIRYIMKHAKSK